jgi:hypothetical protein
MTADVDQREKFFEAMNLRAALGLNTSPEDTFKLNCSISRNCYEDLKNPWGDYIGYIAWARINKETFLSVVRHGYRLSYPYEWEEGYITHVIDVAVNPRWKHYAFRQIRNFIKERKLVFYEKKGRKVIFLLGKMNNI